MWNPSLIIEEMRRAKVLGLSRRFCIRLTSGRGSPELPGRMLGLDQGNGTEGFIFRLPEEELERELEVVWTREMITGLYQPMWVDATLLNGESLKVLAFVADRHHPAYEPDSSVETVAAITAHAGGHIGSNAEYVLRLDETLSAWSICDEYVRKIADILGHKQTEVSGF